MVPVSAENGGLASFVSFTAMIVVTALLLASFLVRFSSAWVSAGQCYATCQYCSCCMHLPALRLPSALRREGMQIPFCMTRCSATSSAPPQAGTQPATMLCMHAPIMQDSQRVCPASLDGPSQAEDLLHGPCCRRGGRGAGDHGGGGAEGTPQGVPHVATFSAVRMRFVDDVLLRALAGLHAHAPTNGAGPTFCQVGRLSV